MFVLIQDNKQSHKSILYYSVLEQSHVWIQHTDILTVAHNIT